MRLFAGEAVNGFAFVDRIGLGNGLGPGRIVEAVGIELGLQGHAAVAAVVYPVFSLVIQVVAGVELNAGAVGVDAQAPAGSGVCQGGTGVAENLPVVIIAALELQSIVIGVQIPGDGLGHPEIHGAAGHVPQLPCGDVLGIVRGKMPGGHGEHLMDCPVRVLVACQVKIAVVGHIKNRILVGLGPVADVEAALAVQSISDPDMGISREALVHVGTFEGERHFGRTLFFQRPQTVLEEVRAGVKVVVVFVGGQGNTLVPQGEFRVPQTVGIPAHGGTQKAAGGNIEVRVIKTQNDVSKVPLGIRYQQ